MMVHAIIAVTLIIMFGIVQSSMLADVVEDSEISTGRREEGLFFAARTFAAKATSGIGTLFAGIALDLIHFPRGAVPGTVPADAVFNLGLIYGPLLMVFYLLALGSMCFYRITRAGHGENLRVLRRAQRDRTRRRSDHRRGRFGRRGRVEPGGYAHAYRLLRARRLDEAVATIRAPPRTGKPGVRPVSHRPERAGRDTDYPINNDDSAVTVVNFNGVGGSTILYGAHFPRLHPSDFRVRTLDGVADDWPIDYDTLEPYFATNDRMMGVSGLAGDPMYPPKQPPLPPLPIGLVGEVSRAASTSWAGIGGRPTARSSRSPTRAATSA